MCDCCDWDLTPAASAPENQVNLAGFAGREHARRVEHARKVKEVAVRSSHSRKRDHQSNGERWSSKILAIVVVGGWVFCELLDPNWPQLTCWVLVPALCLLLS